MTRPAEQPRAAADPPWQPPAARGVEVTEGVAPGAGRRLLDLAVAGVALVLLSLPLGLLIVAIRLTSPGPGLYRQVRLGQGGRPFTLVKLRSMRTDLAGPEITGARDARVTRLGWLLRRTSADELPQLWNVLRGEMTLVGPRPETPALAALYPDDVRWIFTHRPGLTGRAQVRLRDPAVVRDPRTGLERDPADPRWYAELLVPARAAQDAVYLADPTLRATVRVLADTVRYLAGRDVPG